MLQFLEISKIRKLKEYFQNLEPQDGDNTDNYNKSAFETDWFDSNSE